VLQDEALLPGDAAGDVGGHGDAVGVAEDLDPAVPAGWLSAAQPAQAFGVVAERAAYSSAQAMSKIGGAGRAWSKSMRAAGCSPCQTPFQGPKSPWQPGSRSSRGGGRWVLPAGFGLVHG
jgi:hypothetical protein